MSTYEPSFDERLRRLNRKHRQMADNGVVRRLGADGLVMYVPRRRLPRFPWRACLVVLAIAAALKLFLVSSIGVAEYQDRLAPMTSGSFAEKAAAFVLQADPLTERAVAWIDGLRG